MDYFIFTTTVCLTVQCLEEHSLKTDRIRLCIPTRCDGTRWVGHQLLAATSVLISLKFIVAHMEHVVSF